MTRCLFFPHDKIRAKHRNAQCLTLIFSLMLSDAFPGIPYMFDRAGLDIAQEIHRNREFYRTQDVRPPFTYASLIRQVREGLSQPYKYSQVLNKSSACHENISTQNPVCGTVMVQLCAATQNLFCGTYKQYYFLVPVLFVHYSH